MSPKKGTFYIEVYYSIYKLFSAMWLLPEYWVYGGWPMSGEIDIIEIIGAKIRVNVFPNSCIKI